jgi:FeS assembly protein IscX
MKWTDIEEIAEELDEKYPTEDILRLRFTTLFQYITSLDKFADENNRCNEKILEAIQASWIEVRSEK